jgi:hypothetical protein
MGGTGELPFTTYLSFSKLSKALLHFADNLFHRLTTPKLNHKGSMGHDSGYRRHLREVVKRDYEFARSC